MRKRVLFSVAGLLAAVGVGIFNYTGNDITLEEGEKIETRYLQKHLTKHYRERSIEDSLYITVHHTAGSKFQSLESIAKYHVERRGWPEIAYHIAINYKGEVMFLNDIEERTYHAGGFNTTRIGVVLIGNYETDYPTEEMEKSLLAVTDALCLTLKIKGIEGHRDTKATLCPGTNAYNKFHYIFFNNKK